MTNDSSIQIIDPQKLIGPKLEQIHEMKIEAAREEAVANSIEAVRVKILTSNDNGEYREHLYNKYYAQ